MAGIKAFSLEIEMSRVKIYISCPWHRESFWTYRVWTNQWIRAKVSATIFENCMLLSVVFLIPHAHRLMYTHVYVTLPYPRASFHLRTRCRLELIAFTTNRNLREATWFSCSGSVPLSLSFSFFPFCAHFLSLFLSLSLFSPPNVSLFLRVFSVLLQRVPIYSTEGKDPCSR